MEWLNLGDLRALGAFPVWVWFSSIDLTNISGIARITGLFVLFSSTYGLRDSLEITYSHIWQAGLRDVDATAPALCSSLFVHTILSAQTVSMKEFIGLKTSLFNVTHVIWTGIETASVRLWL